MNLIAKKLSTFPMVTHYIQLINMLFPPTFNEHSHIFVEEDYVRIFTGVTSQDTFRETYITTSVDGIVEFSDIWDDGHWCAGYGNLHERGYMTYKFTLGFATFYYFDGKLVKYAYGDDEIDVNQFVFTQGEMTGKTVSLEREELLKQHLVYNMSDMVKMYHRREGPPTFQLR